MPLLFSRKTTKLSTWTICNEIRLTSELCKERRCHVSPLVVVIGVSNTAVLTFPWNSLFPRIVMLYVIVICYTIVTNHRVGLYCAQRDQGGQWWRRTDITRSYTFLICSQTPLIFLLDTLSSRTPHLHCSITRRDTDLRPGARQPRCWRSGWLEEGKLSRILRGETGGEVAPHALELSTGLREISQYPEKY